MSKKFLFFLFLLSLAINTISVYFQHVPGYMDSEYYFLGGQYLAIGKMEAPFIWNYLDDPQQLPHPLFTYWMPLASILSALPMLISANYNFFYGRIMFLLMAGSISPIAAYYSYKITKNKSSAILVGLLAIFSGFYFKFLTIPETVTPYIILGSLYFGVINMIQKLEHPKINWVLFLLLGSICGFMHLSRVDGLVFFVTGFISLFYLGICWGIKKKAPCKSFMGNFLLFIVGYGLIMGWWYFRNFQIYGSFLSPASSRAFWIATYDDTFSFPATILTSKYFFQFGLQMRFEQILSAIKTNVLTFIAVQTGILGFPFFLLGLIRFGKVFILRVVLILYLIVFSLMTFVFPLAGLRGGFLHAGAAFQIPFWILVVCGFEIAIQYGIRKRNWKLIRARIMFGSALVIFSFFITLTVFQKDVIGEDISRIQWEKDYKYYQTIEQEIKKVSDSPQDVVMINNPVGYFNAVKRWAIVFPNASVDDFQTACDKFNVRFIVVDKNLPNKVTDFATYTSVLDLQLIYQEDDIFIYEYNY
ncbi:MAG: hypothetical protein CVU39_03240 [Chloroflexi bacterium HGW-Chloroflexi-10]|nr:MAG: hypothetical protein CVU39_03240 [Chloroflexi bacterium HGW-Chloroflexi-10]